MPDLQKVVLTKARILETIQNKGPTYPARIARDAGLSPLFTAAFLSELVSERKLKMSSMKVGSSPIYYIPGQEPQLENFSDFLNNKEKEAFHDLKKAQVLEDERQEPAIRVALRKIKDFAIPVNVKINGETRLFWKHFQLPEEEVRERIRSAISPSSQTLSVTAKQPLSEESQSPQQVLSVNGSQEIKQLSDNNQKGVEAQALKKSIRPRKPQTSEFAETIKDHLAAKDMEILEEISAKKKEFIAKVRIDTILGKQEFFLISKDKKKATQDDLTIAIQKAQAEKMLALFICPGNLEKSASEYIKEWRNIIKFDKVKI